MLFPEEDSAQLKSWIVNRLKDTSDADADVLADYVLALLRHDGDVQAVRQLCDAEIPDFLKEDSAGFVQDVFDAVQYRSYLPGATQPPPKDGQALSAPSGPNYGNLGVLGAPRGPQNNGNRKRSYNDRGDVEMQDRGAMQYSDSMNDRAFKAPRRVGNNTGRGNFQPYNNAPIGRGQGQAMSPHGFPGMPQMPSPPPGMPPFDPNNPMAAMLAMQQAMGIAIPGLPQPGNHNSSFNGPNQGKSGRKCRDYEQKGFCSRGNSCKFEHGNSMYIPPPSDEYDPSNSSMSGVDLSPAAFQPNQTGFNNFRGSDRGRGRGQRGGDRGGSQRGRGGRAEFSSDRPNFDRSKSTIVVEQIPEDKFSEEAVKEFFDEFGTIEEITMKPYKRLAIIKYDSWDAANTAYKSPKVIFDNRFVKVYWFSGDDCLPKAGAPGSEAKSTKEIEAPIDLEEFARKQEEVQRVHEEKMKKKAEMEVAQKELETRQRELMKSQAEEKRKLMERIAAKSGGGATANVSETPSGKQSQSEALRAQLAALEAEARSLGIEPESTEDAWSSGGRGRGRGGYRGRATFVPRGRGDRGGFRGGRGGAAPYTGNFKLDNRPRKIGLTGQDFTESNNDENLRSFLLGIGEPVELKATASKTEIEFKDRFTAEKFMYGLTDSELPGVGKVDLSWMSTPLPPVDLSKSKHNNGSAAKHEDDEMDVSGGAYGAATGTPGEGYVGFEASSAGGGSGNGNGKGNQHARDLDYDVGDDEVW